jgi:hypothetical protein
MLGEGNNLLEILAHEMMKHKIVTEGVGAFKMFFTEEVIE